MNGSELVAVLKNGVVGYWKTSYGRYERNSGTFRAKYYLTDHLGSTRVVLDEGGTRTEAYDYYAFGLVMPGRGFGNTTKEKFTGKERDNETGWDYFGARYYNPTIARWMNVDPMAGMYPGWSPYNYVMNSPLSFVDPDGNCTKELTGKENYNGSYVHHGKTWQCEGGLFSFPMISKVSSTHAAGKGGSRDYTRGRTSSGVRPYRRLLPDTIERAKSTYDTIGRFLYEPYDWARIGVDCYHDDCDGWDFAGLLPLVPGGLGRAGKWLFKHEGVQRGHTILKHVSQPLPSLQTRLITEPWLPAASTYTDIEIAQDAISQTTNAKRGEIQNWLRNQPSISTKAFDHNVGCNIGEVLYRGSQSTVSSSTARVVLMGQVAFGDALLPLRAVAWIKSTQKSKRQISCVKNATFRPEKWRWASPAQGILVFYRRFSPK